MNTADNLIDMVNESIQKTEKGESKLCAEVAELRGFSTPKIRTLLNNLCSFGACKYLEIGTWSGSTLIPALYANDCRGVAIDNWSQFGPEEMKDGFSGMNELYKNMDKYLVNQERPIIMNGDCFGEFCMSSDKVLGANIFLYDGDHGEEATEKAINIYGNFCQMPFILLVDDWELVDEVRRGAEKALMNFNIFSRWELKKADGFHEGLAVFVVTKK